MDNAIQRDDEVIIPSRVPFELNDGVVTTQPSDRKVTGTTLSTLVGKSPWGTPFSTACRMLRVYNEDIGDKPAVKAGTILEHVIVDHVNERFGTGIIKGDDIFGKQTEDYTTWASHFDDPDFAGHIDGALTDGTIVEVKTGGSPSFWLDKDDQPCIPENYHIQASLYARMTGAEELLFIFGHVKPEERSNPYKWEPKDNIYMFESGLHPEIDDYIDLAREFRAEYTTRGRTPKAEDNPANKEAYKIDSEILEILNVQINVEEQLKLAKLIADRNAELNALTKEIRDAKEKLRLASGYTETGLLDLKTADGGYAVSVSTRRTQRVDNDALKRDGIYDDYLRESSYQVVSVKRY